MFHTDGKIDFAAFLDIMHEHSGKEHTIEEIMTAFRAHDTDKKGYVSTQEAKNILTRLGGGLSRQEGKINLLIPSGLLPHCFG